MSSENFIWIPSLEQSDEGLFALIREERYTITGNNKENNKGRERERKRNHGRSCRTRRVALDRCTYISTLMSLMKYYWWQFWPTLRTSSARSNGVEVCTQSFLQMEMKGSASFGATYRILIRKSKYSHFNYEWDHYLWYFDEIFFSPAINFLPRKFGRIYDGYCQIHVRSMG